MHALFLILLPYVALWVVGTLIYGFCRAFIDAFDQKKIAKDEDAMRRSYEAKRARVAQQQEWLAKDNQQKLNQEELSTLIARWPLTKEEQTRKRALEKSLGVLPAWRLEEEGFSPYR